MESVFLEGKIYMKNQEARTHEYKFSGRMKCCLLDGKSNENSKYHHDFPFAKSRLTIFIHMNIDK